MLFKENVSSSIFGLTKRKRFFASNIAFCLTNRFAQTNKRFVKQKVCCAQQRELRTPSQQRRITRNVLFAYNISLTNCRFVRKC
ncbi:MAG: hypothetical protein EOO34_00175 [Cyanobacteriota bacterium]|nr:MAG: hypothetical protein EOO34_00175 [Cyanobacteriota bacterium]